MPVLPHPTNYAQKTYYDCGPASIVVALGARGVSISESAAAVEAGTTIDGTPSILDIITVLDKHLGAGTYRPVWVPGSSVSAEQVAQLRADLVASVDAGYALVANVVGTATTADGAEVNSYPGGHYLTPTGYDGGGDRAYISDVADGHEYWMTTKALAGWIAGRGYATLAAPAASTVEDEMLVVVRKESDKSLWLSNGITIRPIGSDAELADLQYLAKNGALTIWHNGEVWPGLVPAFGQPVGADGQPIAVDYDKIDGIVRDAVADSLEGGVAAVRPQ